MVTFQKIENLLNVKEIRFNNDYGFHGVEHSTKNRLEKLFKNSDTIPSAMAQWFTD